MNYKTYFRMFFSKNVFVSEGASVTWGNPYWQQVTEALLVFFSLVLSHLVQITPILRLNDKTLIIQVTNAKSSERGFLDRFQGFCEPQKDSM